MPQIDFNTIRHFRGTQHNGFEELNVQLFRAQFGEPFEVVRVEGAGGDGGVEAFFRDVKGNIDGLQAKFFRKLGASQWAQIRKSVARARASHPKLRTYTVGVPLNRTPTQDVTWDAIVAQEKRHGVKLVWWGESELLDLLSRGAHAGRLQYWFGSPDFSDAWLDDKNRAAVADLDSRYTPKHHVEVASERVLRAFARFDEFGEKHYKTVRRVLAAQRSCAWSLKIEKPPKNLITLRNKWKKHWEARGSVFGDGTQVPVMSALVVFLNESIEQMREIWLLLQDLRSKATASTPDPTYASSPFDSAMSESRKFLSEARKSLGFWQELLPIDASYLLVLGEAGAGKSHLLAKLLEDAREKKQIALLCLGEYFHGTNPPWEQWRLQLGWSDTIQELFGCLDTAAEATGKPALLCIDALNESSDRALWHTGLRAMATQLKSYPHIRLVVSCRSDFARLTLPDQIRDGTEPGWATIQHAGFGRQLFTAVKTYFEGYGIQSDHFPPLLSEFENPLFLKTLCEAYENDRFPSGPLSLTAVMDRRVAKVCKKLLRDIDCPTNATKAAILLVAREVAQNNGNPVDRDALRTKIDPLFPGHGDSRSLYRHLLSNGVLVEVGSNTNAIHVRFPYERFSEYFIASEMLSGITSAKSLTQTWNANGVLTLLTDANAEWAHGGLIWALSILIAERFSTELVALLGKKAEDHHYKTLLATFPWRSAQSFSAITKQVFANAESRLENEVLTTLLRVSTIPGHPYNADYLHARLAPMQLYRREFAWTIQVTQDFVFENPSVAKEIIDWTMDVPLKHVPDEQALLVGTVLGWCLSSNHCGLRENATRACLRIMKSRSDVAAQLVERFGAINDPYVVERIYCAAAGAAMAELDPNKLRRLAATVHSAVFSNAAVPPHILLRDYACTVLEAAAMRGCLPPGVTVQSFRPPYRSKMPRIWSETKTIKIEKTKGWERIASSVRPENMGGYGDFGRYVMGSALHHYSSIPLNQPAPVKFRAHSFDHKMGRRWIVQRVHELGWSPQRFEAYEKNLHQRSRHDNDAGKVERISKKYQWIALRELQGYLTDHYHVSEGWGDKATPFKGAWEISAREFDPSQPPAEASEERDADGFGDRRPEHWWELRHPSPFANAVLVEQRGKWVASKEVGDFANTLHVTNQAELSGDWLMLAGMLNWREPLAHDTLVAGRGQLTMWTFVRSWLVKKADVPRFLRAGKDVDFYGNGCEHPTIRDEWLGEYAWAPPYAPIRGYCEGTHHWLKTITVPAVATACDYQHETVSGYVPSPQVLDLLGATWEGDGFRFAANGKTVALGQFKGRKSPLFVDAKALTKALNARNLVLLWTLVGERDCWDSMTTSRPTGNVTTFSAIYVWSGKTAKGKLTAHEVQHVR